MKQTRKQMADDLAYWRELADLTGWQLYGWTYKMRATYVVADETIQMSCRQRDATVAHLTQQKGG